MKTGIQTRLLLLTSGVLAVFLSLAGFVLDRSFQASVKAGAEEQLRLVVFSLMGSIVDEGGDIRIGLEVPEPRLVQPQSGLYAGVFGVLGETYWRSPSSVAAEFEFPGATASLQPGDFRFSEVLLGGVDRYSLSYSVIWESVEDVQLVFNMVADQAPYQKTMASFRRSLYLGLAGVIALFAIAQALAVRWGLRPLRTMAEEVAQLESGQREQLSAAYPVELKGLARNLDRFVSHEKRSRTRYRKAMEDLAHSLKTPLAVLRNGLRSRSVPDGETQDFSLLREQVDRMETTVSYQLSRASVTGPVIVGKPVAVGALVDRLLRALGTAYQSKQIQVETHIPERFYLRGDERDLLEMIGNLLENGFKYTRSRVLVRAEEAGMRALIVEDDGPGIDPEIRAKVLRRGTRADQVQPGQGIGLSVVVELIRLYQGDITIAESRWGGAKITLNFPQLTAE
ncbi:MAG: ATP-binding protein [Pseudomonadota bacterium]